MSLYALLIVDKYWSNADRAFHHAESGFHTVTTTMISAIRFFGWHGAWSSYHHGTTIQLYLTSQSMLPWLYAQFKLFSAPGLHHLHMQELRDFMLRQDLLYTTWKVIRFMA